MLYDGYDSFTYDGYDTTPLLILTDIRRYLLPPIQLDTEEFGSDGALLLDSRFEPSTIETDILLLDEEGDKATSRMHTARVRRQLSALLYRRETKPLILPDEPDVHYMALLSGQSTIDTLFYGKEATLEWTCPDPVAYGRSHKRISNGGIESILIDGTYPTNPIIEVSAQGPFQMLFDDQVFEVTGSVNGTVVIDTRDPRFFKGGRRVYAGNSLVAHSAFSDFPKLAPGIHEIGCQRPFTVNWEDRWL